MQGVNLLELQLLAKQVAESVKNEHKIWKNTCEERHVAIIKTP